MKKEDGFWTNKLQDLWRSVVSTYPDRACAVQGMLECTGYNTSCASVVGSSADCPTNCEDTNSRYFVPCRNIIRKYIWDNYDTIVMILAVCGGLLFGGIMFNFIYFCGLVKAKREIREGHKKSIQRVHSRRSGGAAGPVQNRHKALYILKSLDNNDTTNLIREFKRMDVNGDEVLSRSEMALFFKRAMCYNPSREEIECIFELADVDNSGGISLQEFLAIFGRQAPMSKETALRRQASAAAVRQRMRQKLAGTAIYDPEDDANFEGYSPAPRQAASPGVLRTPQAHYNKYDDRDLDEML